MRQDPPVACEPPRKVRLTWNGRPVTLVFTVCFVAGLLLALVMALSGDLHLAHGHAGGAHHAAGHHAAAGHHSTGSALQGVLGFALSWLSPVTLAGGALIFGAVGLLLRGSILAVPLALATALVGAAIFRALLSALLRSSSPPLALSGEGAIATVNATIRPGVPGEVGYTLEGLHRSAIARSEAPVELPRGTQVVITRQAGGVAWVDPIDPLDELSQSNETKE